MDRGLRPDGMRILLVNKFLRQMGGAETVFFTEWAMLESAGHRIIPFGVAHPDNEPSPFQKFWLPEMDYARPTWRQGFDLLWSRRAARQMSALVEECKPDIAHLHNIYHQISPSILPVLTAAGIPIVMTLHDYKLICPNYRLFTDGAPCQRCVTSHTWHALRHRCHRASWRDSAVVALESAYHRRIKAYDPVTLFIAPSQFMHGVLLRAGIPEGRIRIMPHCVAGGAPDEAGKPGLVKGPFVLYAGRLEEEKGLESLMAAAQRLPEVRFVLAGAGSMEARLSEAAASLRNLMLVGKLDAGRLLQLRRRARAEVMPAIWPEVFGMSALEAMEAGLPVIASAIGGLPDMVRHEETGLLITPGSVEELVEAVLRLWMDEALAISLGAAGRKLAVAHYQPEQHLEALLEIYAQVMNRQLSPSPAREG